MRLLLFSILCCSLMMSCDTESGILERTNNFEQESLLDNLGNEIILSSYKTLSNEATSLREAVGVFNTNASVENLEMLRSKLFNTRMAWQACIPFQFGPADVQGLAGKINIYPIDVNQVERNISEGNYNLSSLSNTDAKGLPALGYLLYSDNLNDEELIELFDESRMEYLTALTTEIEEITTSVYEDWSPESGNYIADFTSEEAFGTSVGSSLANIINAWNVTFERQVRDGKVGIPSGMRTNGVPVVENTEAYYGGYSVALLTESVDAFHQLYLGGEGVGFDDYLQEIGATTTDNDDLATKIDGQFKVVKASITNLSDPLPAQIEADKAAVQKVFADMQALVLLFKTDMASSLGVVITYQDNDGD